MAMLCEQQDGSNSALWSATQAGKMELSLAHLGLTCHVLQENIHQEPYNKPFIDEACSVKMTRYWPGSFLLVYGPRLHLGL